MLKYKLKTSWALKYFVTFNTIQERKIGICIINFGFNHD